MSHKQLDAVRSQVMLRSEGRPFYSQFEVGLNDLQETFYKEALLVPMICHFLQSLLSLS